jgi:hypothetical protein
VNDGIANVVGDSKYKSGTGRQRSWRNPSQEGEKLWLFVEVVEKK